MSDAADRLAVARHPVCVKAIEGCAHKVVNALILSVLATSSLQSSSGATYIRLATAGEGLLARRFTPLCEPQRQQLLEGDVQ